MLPVNAVQADSLLYLQSSPVGLIALPAFLGFSFGLNVFSYGSSYSWLRTLILVAAFYFFGNYGFYIGPVLNLIFFYLAKSRDLNPRTVRKKTG